ncbi:MAG: hypothetical protein AAGE88_18355 [Actinomycetota bacterium]
MTRPVHLPSCDCGGSGLIRTETKVESTGSAAARTYSGLADCTHPTPTAEQWTAWATRQLAAGRRTQTSGGVVNQADAAHHIAAARAGLGRPTTETRP